MPIGLLWNRFPETRATDRPVWALRASCAGIPRRSCRAKLPQSARQQAHSAPRVALNSPASSSWAKKAGPRRATPEPCLKVRPRVAGPLPHFVFHSASQHLQRNPSTHLRDNLHPHCALPLVSL